MFIAVPLPLARAAQEAQTDFISTIPAKTAVSTAAHVPMGPAASRRPPEYTATAAGEGNASGAAHWIPAWAASTAPQARTKSSSELFKKQAQKSCAPYF